MQPFVYNALSGRVVFGSGTLGEAGAEVERLGFGRVVVLTTPQQEQQGQDLAQALGSRAVGVFAEAAMHTPIEVTRRAVTFAEKARADATVSIGGGSTTGLGKALALHVGLPQIAIPTTYAGSEMTNILGQTEGGKKTTLRDDKLRPKTVIYDVDLTIGLPVAMSMTSGLNAIAHAMEALYAPDGNPVIALMAEEGTRALGTALPTIKADPANAEARSDALYGAWLCSICLASTSMALHHKLCHTLGGTFDLPHAETHAIVLPHAAAYNAPAAPDAMARIARALGRSDGDGAAALFDLTGTIGAPNALKDFGMPEDGIDRAADIATENPYQNPRAIERGAIRAMIANAWAGAPPA